MGVISSSVHAQANLSYQDRNQLVKEPIPDFLQISDFVKSFDSCVEENDQKSLFAPVRKGVGWSNGLVLISPSGDRKNRVEETPISDRVKRTLYLKEFG